MNFPIKSCHFGGCATESQVPAGHTADTWPGSRTPSATGTGRARDLHRAPAASSTKHSHGGTN